MIRITNNILFLILLYYVANQTILRLKCYIESFILTQKKKKKKNNLTVPSEKSKTVSFSYSIMEETVAS